MTRNPMYHLYHFLTGRLILGMFRKTVPRCLRVSTKSLTLTVMCPSQSKVMCPLPTMFISTKYSIDILMTLHRSPSPHHVFFFHLTYWTDLRCFFGTLSEEGPVFFFYMGHVYILSGIFPIGWVSEVPPWGQHVVPTARENAEIGCREVDARSRAFPTEKCDFWWFWDTYSWTFLRCFWMTISGT